MGPPTNMRASVMRAVSVHTGRPRRQTMEDIRSASTNATRRSIFESVETCGLSATKKTVLARRARLVARDASLSYAAQATAAMKRQRYRVARSRAMLEQEPAVPNHKQVNHVKQRMTASTAGHAWVGGVVPSLSQIGNDTRT